jgi:hypothetical protein
MEATHMTNKEASQLNSAKAEIKSFWDAACAVEGIDPASKFVVFAHDNLFAKDYNDAMLDFMKLRTRIAQQRENRMRALTLQIKVVQ